MTEPTCPVCRERTVLKYGFWCTPCSLEWLWELGMYNPSPGTPRYLTEAEKVKRWGASQ